MKTFTFIALMLFLTSVGFSQRNPIDFETGGYGTDWTWNVFENDTNPALEIIENPDKSGINTSATVAKFTALQSGNPWAGCENAHGADNLGPFVLGTDNSTIKILVWKSVISDVGIKLVSSNGWAQAEIKKANTKVNEWEELSFDFSAYTNPPAEEGQLDQIVVFPDYNLDGRAQDNIVYFDNITFSEQVATEGPATAAPAPPTREASKVISLFSDAYTDVPVDTWRTDWSSAVLNDITIEGNATKKYSTLDFVGIETAANQLDITDMTHLHVDVWSADFTSFGIKLVDYGANGAYAGGDDVEHQVNIDAPAQGEWVSMDIPLTDFTGLTTKENLAQYVLSGKPAGGTTVYVDNMYFYNETVAAEGPRNPIDFEEGGYGADWTWNVFENDTNPALEIIANPDQSGINTSATVAKFTALQTGNAWAGCENAHGADYLGPFVLGPDNSTIKIMVWKPVISDVGIKLVSPTGWAQTEMKKANTVVNAWEELTFDFSAYTNPPEAEGQLDQIVVFPDYNLDGRAQDNIVYFDNITFSEQVATEGPATAAPAPPTREASKVISLFSDAYTDVPVDTWRTDWSSAVLNDITIEGNATKKYSTLDFVGIETAANQLDITDMTHLHVDVWSADFTSFGIKLVDYGANGAYAGGDDVEHQVNIDAPAQGEWVSMDIPLTDFTGLTTKENLAQYVLSGKPAGGTTVYVDNMYFYDANSTNTREFTKESGLQLYPNPVKAGAMVQLGAEVNQIDIFDYSGRNIRTLRTTSKINTEDLDKGVYILRIRSKTNALESLKLVVY